MLNAGSEAVDEVAGSHKERGINQLKNRKWSDEKERERERELPNKKTIEMKSCDLWERGRDVKSERGRWRVISESFRMEFLGFSVGAYMSKFQTKQDPYNRGLLGQPLFFHRVGPTEEPHEISRELKPWRILSREWMTALIRICIS